MTTPARIDGIDLSHWQDGALDFAAAKKAGVRFVFHKATEGTGYADPNYSNRRAPVAKAGITFGAYHYANATGTPEQQARHFLAVAAPKAGDLRPALDFEDKSFASWSVARKTAWVKAFVDVIEQVTGVKPFVYIPGTWALSDHFDCPLWVPRYSGSMMAPRIPKPWRAHTIWQFSNGEIGTPNTVPGIGKCDINTINGDPARIVEAFTIGHRAPAPTPVPGTQPPSVPGKRVTEPAAPVTRGAKIDHAIADLAGSPRWRAKAARRLLLAIPPLKSSGK